MQIARTRQVPNADLAPSALFGPRGTCSVVRSGGLRQNDTILLIHAARNQPVTQESSLWVSQLRGGRRQGRSLSCPGGVGDPPLLVSQPRPEVFYTNLLGTQITRQAILTTKWGSSGFLVGGQRVAGSSILPTRRRPQSHRSPKGGQEIPKYPTRQSGRGQLVKGIRH